MVPHHGLDHDSDRSMFGHDALTAREREVALWLSHGKTNREIATILTVKLRTVEKHVEHVLQKLCVENRTTAAILLVGRRLERL